MSDILASIVMRSYNEERHIGNLLKGIYEQSIIAKTEVIIVDSGSTDSTIKIAKNYPVNILHIEPHEFSFGGSLNIGCQVARGEFIVMVSSHVYPLHKDWLEILVEPFCNKKIALVYGKQRGSHTSKYSEQQIFKKWFPDGSKSVQNHPFCNNANAAIRSLLWEKMPYDETLTGLEDVDWANRIMQLGYRIAYVADAEVVHIHDECARAVRNRYRREAIALKRIFPHERFTLWDFVRLLTSNVLSDYYHAWREHQLWSHVRSIPAFRLMQFWGTYRGYAQRGAITSQLRQKFYYPNGWTQSPREAERAKLRPIIEYERGAGRGYVG